MNLHLQLPFVVLKKLFVFLKLGKLFYEHVNEYNYDLKNDDITDALDYEIYEMFNYYLYLLDQFLELQNI